ncbi:L-erythro-3,5-diaminohexanoate dehydrogenase [Shimazuella alba]|uniref:L-erythro-3,5-diaminohexanoate dehydrogenase n=1 Tax=Shimazuella alba TaxID=2690964 RepID=A0A6I4VY71_9BACL|nr:L-erythro-3,5-diaminohexanoate dehydrogenase [Shimazuella alba]MXQ53012.1 L-erythro-3,5-diaminohexanoate dehydrogenase [Shimazuella alba]
MLSHYYGLHRTLSPAGVFPQPAWSLDPSLPIHPTELLVDIEALHIDSASFTQLKQEANGSLDLLTSKIKNIILDRGKMHNPVTGSGGMFIGRVKEVGEQFADPSIRSGQMIASLVSLTLTPLSLTKIKSIDMVTGQIEIDGHAILFSSSPFAVLPKDMNQRVALAVLDVCGAPAQAARFIEPHHVVVVLGAGGKSGLLTLAEARRKVDQSGIVIAMEHSKNMCKEVEALSLAHHVCCVDATNPVAVLEAVSDLTDSELADITFNCVNVPGTELSSIVATRDEGIVYFFSMAVQFTSAALGAEGIGKDVKLMIGNGYAPGHANHTLELLRNSPSLMELFTRRYGS